MARQSYLNVLAFVSKEPKVANVIDGQAGIVKLTTIMSDRDFAKATTGYQKNSVEFCARSNEQNIVDEISKLGMYDIVMITGFIATKEVDKKAMCDYCGFENRRTEACLRNGTPKSGGNEIYVYPLAIQVLRKCEDYDESEQEQCKAEAYAFLHQHQREVNRVFIVGNLTCDPIQGVLDGGRKIYTRFQVAVNRKYCPKGGSEFYVRTDYPWVYSYGDKAIEDYQNLKKGALVYIDGALQSRKFKEQYVCQNPDCRETFDVPGSTLEVLSYDTEYLRIPKPISDTEQVDS